MSNLYVFPFTKVNFCWVNPSITKTLFGGGVPGFSLTVTVKDLKSYWPITLVWEWTLNSPYNAPSTLESLLYPESILSL